MRVVVALDWWRDPKGLTAAQRRKKFNRQIPAHRELRRRVYYRDDFTCYLCGWRPQRVPELYDGNQVVSERGRQLHLDHVTPFSQGGETCIANLRVACCSCNYRKGAKAA